MIKSLPQIFLTLLLLLFTFTAFCQKDSLNSQTDSLRAMIAKAKTADKGSEASSSFKFGVSYISNNVFMGRADTVTTPMVVPEVKYTFKNGIYASGSLDIIPNKTTHKLDGGDITAGYEFDINDDLSGSASFAKLFYSSTSTQIAAAISATANANLTYDIGDIISVTVSSDYNVNKQGINNDVFVNGGLSHDFIAEGIFGEKDVFLISPTASINAGTQNFYDAYLVLTKKIRSAKRTKALDAIIAQYTNQLSQFEILDYEFSAPLEYKIGHFIFQFTPTYAVVENQLPKTIETRIPNKPSVFYFETGVFLKF